MKSCLPNDPLLFTRPAYEVVCWGLNFVIRTHTYTHILFKITVDVKSRNRYHLHVCCATNSLSCTVFQCASYKIQIVDWLIGNILNNKAILYLFTCVIDISSAL